MQLGYPSADALLKSMTSAQWSEWLAFANIEPIGEFRNELRHGQMMALHCNINRDSKQRPEPYTAKDFTNFIEWPEEKPVEQSPEELAAAIKNLLRGRNG